MTGRKFHIDNLGCAKNQVDAESIISSLTRAGWEYTDAAGADMIIINTCGFIKPAKEESIQTLLSYRQQYPDRKIVLAGCLAQRYGKELSGSLPEADAIFGNRFPEMINLAADRFMDGTLRIFMPEEEGPAGLPADSAVQARQFPGTGGAAGKAEKGMTGGERISLSFPGSAYVKIAEGCSNNCSYCAIPLIRGQLRSRNEDAILGEIKALLAGGIFEINLIAQDLASYGNDLSGKTSLSSLLGRISALGGSFWVRLLYMHPDRFDPAVAEAIKSDSRILPYFDIPFQHASKRILSAMGRRGDYSSYLKLIEYIRGRVDNAVMRSTFLVGFPGERESDYRQVVSFLGEARLDWAGFFQYSREEGTSACRMGNSFSNYLLSRKTPGRVSELMDIQSGITASRLERFVGIETDVLAEEAIKGEEIVIGRGYMNAPEVDGAIVIRSGDIRPGTVTRCRILRRNDVDLEAEPV